jgi:hypothetical protein
MFKHFAKILTYLILNLALLGIFSNLAYAQGGTVTRPPIIPAQNQPIQLPHQTGDTNQDDYLINQFLPGVAATIISITGGLALVFAIFNGIMMIASGGDPEKFGKAKQGLIWALIGIIIAGLSFAIVAIISSINF